VDDIYSIMSRPKRKSKAALHEEAMKWAKISMTATDPIKAKEADAKFLEATTKLKNFTLNEGADMKLKSLIKEDLTNEGPIDFIKQRIQKHREGADAQKAAKLASHHFDLAQAAMERARQFDFADVNNREDHEQEFMNQMKIFGKFEKLAKGNFPIREV
jgi:hypothetical protein